MLWGKSYLYLSPWTYDNKRWGVVINNAFTVAHVFLNVWFVVGFAKRVGVVTIN